MRILHFTLLFLFFALSQGCVSDNPQFDRIIQSLPSFMIQMGAVTLPPGGSADGSEYCYATAIHPQDEGIFCAGWTNGSFAEQSSGTPDAYIVKFDRDKNLLWARQFGAVTLGGKGGAFLEQFTSLAFDSRGNVYAGGATSTGLAIIAKFGRKGEVIYKRTITQSTKCKLIIWRDRLFCAGVDSTFAFAQVYEVDQNGNVLWLTQTTGGSEDAYEIVVDHSGNFIITGITNASLNPAHNPVATKTDVMVWKVSNIGAEIWIDQIGTDAFEEYANDIAIDRSGNIILGGSFVGSGAVAPDTDFDPDFTTPNKYQAFLASYEDTGAGVSENWVIRSRLAQDNFANSVAITANNQIAVGGTTRAALYEPLGGGATNDAFIGKVSASGTFLFGRQFGLNSVGNGTNANYDVCFALAVDPLGNIVCGGVSNGSTNEANGGNNLNDIMIWRVGPDMEF